MLGYEISMIGRHKVLLLMERFPTGYFYLDHGRVDLVDPEQNQEYGTPKRKQSKINENLTNREPTVLCKNRREDIGIEP